jgi:site-specific DNA recombinase
MVCGRLRPLENLDPLLGIPVPDLGAAARTDPVAGLIAEREVVQQKWDACSPAIKGQIIDALMTVTVMPCPSGQRVFDPQYVRIDWKR